ncbi:hypothetical protein NM688_g6867 [Phlebia brevispora]|uniref:Uncharacterized protein n=1 Tax=Phlebia brevispora TaxID=194682 RepID=A0ACC1SBL1_9APHY|nr:hypothetical protein NM688_g6867 [Phlebia brevispora]
MQNPQQKVTSLSAPCCCACNAMSLATGALTLLARSGHGHHPSIKWTTSLFCEWLEKAVDYMQSPVPVRELDMMIYSNEGHEFVNLVWRAVHAGRFYMLAGVVMLFFDYVVTMDMEVEQIWKRKQNMVAYLFYVNRYLPLVTYLFVILSVFLTTMSNHFCVRVFATLPPAMIVTSEAIVGLLRMAKVYALWKNDLNRYFGLATIVVYLLQTLFAIVAAVALQGVGPFFGPNNEIGCFVIFHSGSMPRIIMHWFINLVFNVMIFCFILRKALTVRKVGGDAYLADILVRDAVMFLVVLSAVKIGNLIMVILFPYWNAINWCFNNMADVILTSRLIFNLRTATMRAPPTESEKIPLVKYGVLNYKTSAVETHDSPRGDSDDVKVFPGNSDAFIGRRLGPKDALGA